ncbi:MAG TPA: rhodanese-like domain-containing protein [Methanocella sp.]|nr:rhodanese-like domain-containing protein [Methanocella sp.]
MYEQKARDITVDDLKGRMRQKDKPVMVLDARSAEAYIKGHIPGACSLFDAEIISAARKLDKNVDIIVYGPGQAVRSMDPADRLAGDAINRLISMGYKNCMELKGGFEAWANAGNQIDMAKPESIKPERFKSIEELQSLLPGG